MNPETLLQKYCTTTEAYDAILLHGRMVAGKARAVARRLGDRLDLQFIEEAALLHDIGVALVQAPHIGCHGDEPYIRHGIIGREILEREALPRHALVCERHIGVGLTTADIAAQNLPLPPRDMVPESTEERIICFADLFFSKKPDKLRIEKPVDKVRSGLARFDPAKVVIFDRWLAEFGV